jgi:transposase InsO family protein
MRFSFIDQHRRRWPIEVMCRVLRVARSGYYTWRHRQASPRLLWRQRLMRSIAALFQEHRRVYGSPRLHRALLARGERVCLNTVARLMRQQRLAAKTKAKFTPRTTDSRHQQPVASNVLHRQFTADKPNRKWVADITYIPTGEGWLYLAAVLDLCSRRIVGWSMAEHLRSDLVADALRMALTQRGIHARSQRSLPGALPGAGAGELLHHSDRGVQYASEAYQDLLARHQIRCSMSARGDCYDNAVMESFWGTLKRELVHHERYATRDEARASIFQYIEVFYNRTRLHSTLDYTSPEAFEARLN